MNTILYILLGWTVLSLILCIIFHFCLNEKTQKFIISDFRYLCNIMVLPVFVLMIIVGFMIDKMTED